MCIRDSGGDDGGGDDDGKHKIPGCPINPIPELVFPGTYEEMIAYAFAIEDTKVKVKELDISIYQMYDRIRYINRFPQLRMRAFNARLSGNPPKRKGDRWPKGAAIKFYHKKNVFEIYQIARNLYGMLKNEWPKQEQRIKQIVDVVMSSENEFRKRYKTKMPGGRFLGFDGISDVNLLREVYSKINHEDSSKHIKETSGWQTRYILFSLAIYKMNRLFLSMCSKRKIKMTKKEATDLTEILKEMSSWDLKRKRMYNELEKADIKLKKKEAEGEVLTWNTPENKELIKYLFRIFHELLTANNEIYKLHQKAKSFDGYKDHPKIDDEKSFIENYKMLYKMYLFSRGVLEANGSAEVIEKLQNRYKFEGKIKITDKTINVVIEKLLKNLKKN